jgi:hypothetical protein
MHGVAVEVSSDTGPVKVEQAAQAIVMAIQVVVERIIEAREVGTAGGEPAQGHAVDVGAGSASASVEGAASAAPTRLVKAMEELERAQEAFGHYASEIVCAAGETGPIVVDEEDAATLRRLRRAWGDAGQKAIEAARGVA